jgi:hypothetical protein
VTVKKQYGFCAVLAVYNKVKLCWCLGVHCALSFGYFPILPLYQRGLDSRVREEPFTEKRREFCAIATPACAMTADPWRGRRGERSHLPLGAIIPSRTLPLREIASGQTNPVRFCLDAY